MLDACSSHSSIKRIWIFFPKLSRYSRNVFFGLTFAPIERHPEKGTTSATLLARMHSRLFTSLTSELQSPSMLLSICYLAIILDLGRGRISWLLYTTIWEPGESFDDVPVYGVSTRPGPSTKLRILVIVNRRDDFLARVHDKRPVLHNRFSDWHRLQNQNFN